MHPPDRIELRGLRTSSVVGVLDHERTQAQPLEWDLDLLVDLSHAAASDELDDTVDYGAVCEQVVDVGSELEPRLLEHLAAAVADRLLDGHPTLDAVTVRVRKLRPPVAQDLASSGVRITRARP